MRSNANTILDDPELFGDEQVKMVDVYGAPLRVAIRPGTGNRIPLLIMNGIGANLELLTPFIEKMDPEIQVIAFDAPGVGGSPAPVLPYRMAGLAKLVARMLDRLGHQQVDVLGVSWGGALAQEFARTYPRRCHRLILAATATGAMMVPGKPTVFFKMMTPRRYLQPAYMTAIAPKIYGGSLRNDPEAAARHVSHIMSSGIRGYFWQIFALWGWTSVHWLHRLTQPTLILAGRDDPIVPLINAKFMARQVPDSILHIFDCGHLFLITRAEEAAQVVHRFLVKKRHSHA
ncbi:MAG: poly(3-hydroxyalkanoate) depolymerase [Gammaproteobacteria bacterium]|nr:poly(3-hydroxyalkanoate) depolymerase [Gammaproteobacteria bacterium]MCP5423515.1 poly(3-hydroxyalkanoate) depolymerase [Gammaproteobacteria bacterium]